MTFACAGAGLDAGAALACAGGGVPAGFGFVRAWTAAGACVAFAVVLGFFADFSFSGVPVGADVAVAPCVAAGVPQDCHGQHIALAGSVRSINADTAKGTVNFAFIEPFLFTVLSGSSEWRFLGHLLRSGAEAALITTTQIPQWSLEFGQQYTATVDSRCLTRSMIASASAK
jgi:hypothetical protein